MRAQRVLTLALGAITLVGSAGYLFVYLYRWEWNRALIAGVVFLAAEIGVVGWSLHGRLAEAEAARGREEAARRRRIVGHLDEARARPSRPFAWLEPDGSRLGVFIPVLLGAGLVLSSLAWIVERVSRATVGRSIDRGVAERLCRLGTPPGGFLDDRDDPLRALRGPIGGPP